jgi:copper chaperone CopZ
MRAFTVVALAIALLLSTASTADTIEVDVHGLTCAFCVDSLQRQLQKLPDIEQVDVSLKSKKVRIVSSAAHVDIARIREIVIDSGFTPVNIRVIEDEI